MDEFHSTDFNELELFCGVCDCKILFRSIIEIEFKIPLEFLTFKIPYRQNGFPNLRVAKIPDGVDFHSANLN